MTKNKYKEKGVQGIFDVEFRIEQINEKQNILKKILRAIDFELFRPLLEEYLVNHNKKSNVGAKPYDPVLMFKILIIQQIFGLSDDQAEFQIMDRTSFQQFLGLTMGDKVPDAKSIWNFREKITKQNLERKLFDLFRSFLMEKEMIINEGKMVDASIVSVPRQRNKKDENDKIKSGNGDKLWEDKPNKKRQKDIDAKWLKKNGENFYGYKDHTKVDLKTKLIANYEVTDASVHDSQALDDLLEESDSNQILYGDSAYSGEEQTKTIKKYKMVNLTHEKGYKNKPLTQQQKASNREKSKIRARVEHVYGFVSNSMSDFFSRLIGFERNKCVIGLINLIYNMCRYEQISRIGIH